MRQLKVQPGGLTPEQRDGIAYRMLVWFLDDPKRIAATLLALGFTCGVFFTKTTMAITELQEQNAEMTRKIDAIYNRLVEVTKP